MINFVKFGLILVFAMGLIIETSAEEPIECWDTGAWENATSEKEIVGKGGMPCAGFTPLCTKMTCSGLGGEKPYMTSKGCGQRDFCASPTAINEQAKCENELGGKFACATPCNEDNCNSDFTCMSTRPSMNSRGYNPDVGHDYKFFYRNERNTSIGKETRCNTKYCGMHYCIRRNGMGYDVVNQCVDEDYQCDEKIQKRLEEFCNGFDADYRCVTKCQENNCNEKIPEATELRKCWITNPEGIDALSDAENVGKENEKCEDYQPLCITKTCITMVGGAKKINVTKGCGRKDYCKKAVEAINAKYDCEGDGKEKKGEFSCTECDTDNCNNYRKCWKTQYDKNFDFVEVEDSNPYQRIVFDQAGHTCNHTDVCYTEICKAGQGKLMVRRGCDQPGYCEDQKGKRFCNKQFSAVGGSHHECRECRDNDHCNEPWDRPPPAPAEPQETSAGTNLKGQHVAVMMWMWMASMTIAVFACF